jgi:hypothetical protein
MRIKLSPSPVQNGAALASQLCAGKFKVGYFLDRPRINSTVFNLHSMEFSIHIIFARNINSLAAFKSSQMQSVQLYGSCPPKQGSRIHSHGWKTPEQIADSVILSTSVMSKTVGSGDLLFNMDSNTTRVGWGCQIRFTSQSCFVFSKSECLGL